MVSNHWHKDIWSISTGKALLNRRLPDQISLTQHQRHVPRDSALLSLPRADRTLRPDSRRGRGTFAPWLPILPSAIIPRAECSRAERNHRATLQRNERRKIHGRNRGRAPEDMATARWNRAVSGFTASGCQVESLWRRESMLSRAGVRLKVLRRLRALKESASTGFGVLNVTVEYRHTIERQRLLYY